MGWGGGGKPPTPTQHHYNHTIYSHRNDAPTYGCTRLRALDHRLLTAAGMDLEHFFSTYTVHTGHGTGDMSKARGYLNGLAIGVLSDEDAARAKAEATPNKHIENRMTVIGRARSSMLWVMASLPVWMSVRYTIQAIGR